MVTGPTGSGKTTTLYSALQQMDRKQRNIMTVEDPVEYDLPGISQTQINLRAGMTFARGLRAILRQDPDVILIGEIRDGETAEIATQASLTGHLVLSTLHTNTAAGAITRLQDLGVDSFLLASTVEASPPSDWYASCVTAARKRCQPMTTTAICWACQRAPSCMKPAAVLNVTTPALPAVRPCLSWLP